MLKKDVHYKDVLIETLTHWKDEIVNTKNEVIDAKNNHLDWMKMSIERFLKIYMANPPIFKPLTKYSSNKLLDSAVKDSDESSTGSSDSYLSDEGSKNYIPRHAITHNKFKLEREILIQHTYKKLVNFFGDLILSAYVEDDPVDQTTWVSDAYRKKFFISEELENTVIWKTDAGGVKFLESVIDVLLTSARERLVLYTKQCRKCICYLHDIDGDAEEMRALSRKQLLCQEVFFIIDKRQIHSDILKYVTPHFKINKEEVINKISAVEYIKNKK